MVDILLATYNGERFIAQQLCSLQMQTFTDWKCYVHDDGSMDSTVEIVKHFVAADNRFVFIDDGICFGSAGKNFLHLVKFSTSDYCCFCDQDDIWLDNKLQKYIDAISEKDNSRPQVVFFNSYLYDTEADIISGRATLTFPKNLESLLFLNCGIQGSSGVFNRKMVELLSIPLEKCAMHDHYLTLLGCSLGEISYIHENTMLYRQHLKNVTVNAAGSFREKYKRFFCGKSPVINKLHFEAVNSFYENYKDELAQDEKEKLETFIQSKNWGLLKRLIMVKKYGFRIYDSCLKLIIKILVRPYMETDTK